MKPDLLINLRRSFSNYHPIQAEPDDLSDQQEKLERSTPSGSRRSSVLNKIDKIKTGISRIISQINPIQRTKDRDIRKVAPTSPATQLENISPAVRTRSAVTSNTPVEPASQSLSQQYDRICALLCDERYQEEE